MSIRAANEADIPHLQRLADTTWRIAYQEMLQEEQIDYMLETMYSSEILAKQMTGGQKYFLYEEDDQVQAFISIEIGHPAGVCHVHKLYVSTQQQKKRIGEQLMHFAKKLGLQNQCKHIALYVNRNNKAVHFYKKMGLNIVSSHDFDIGGGYFMNDFYMKGEM